MTPSTEEPKTTTTGQIDKAVGLYRAMLEKHAKEFNLEPVQIVLGQPELAAEQLAVFRRRVEAISNLIVRRVTVVDRHCAGQAMLDATKRKQYTDKDVVAGMPRGVGNEEVEVVFFKPDLTGRDGYINDEDLEKEFELRGLKPADPYSVGAVNETDPAFADEHPHATHWKDGNGKWCYATFGLWGGERKAGVRRSGGEWGDDWWFAGLRK
ncbi:MAG TPA: hypothetical protein VEC13_02735 [Candidatus Paceibacterota bacterium]|nr:hypothetical protein [Candidatus Paceibacterota bacterium]